MSGCLLYVECKEYYRLWVDLW